MIRITGGKNRSRKLVTPETTLTKPTMDKVRAAVFNALGNNLHNLEVLDLFCGSGSYGFEALSRGASYVEFVDQTRFSKEAVLENATNLKETNFKFVESEALSYLKDTSAKFNIVFMDPPYKLEIIQKAISIIEERHILDDNGIIVVECEHELEFDVSQYKEVRHYKYGLAHIYLLRK